MSTGDGPGAAASLPDDPLPSTLKRLFQKMRRTILVPLHSETLRKQGLRREQTGFPVVTGDLPFAGGSASTAADRRGGSPPPLGHHRYSYVFPRF